MTTPYDHEAMWSKAKVFLNRAMDPGSGRSFDEQALWAKLETISRRVQGHRRSGGQIWDRWKTTDERDYDAARSALLVGPRRDSRRAAFSVAPYWGGQFSRGLAVVGRAAFAGSRLTESRCFRAVAL